MTVEETDLGVMKFSGQTGVAVYKQKYWCFGDSRDKGLSISASDNANEAGSPMWFMGPYYPLQFFRHNGTSISRYRSERKISNYGMFIDES